MSKPVSPLLGYNNNVRHKNRVFHIQTEDSGIKHPHIITHLFMDGGRILKSIKRSYAEHVGADKMQDTVKQMMKEQHKAMFIALRDGQFDVILEDGQAAKDKALAAAADASKSAPPSADQMPLFTAPPPAGAVAPSAPPNPAPAPASSRDDVDMVPQTTRTPEISLDIDPLERGLSSPGSGRELADLPPPPANMFRDKNLTGGTYKASPLPEQTGKRASAFPPKKIPSSPPKKVPSAPPKRPATLPPARGKTPSEGRYAAARPAAIFGQARPQQGSSIFGEDLISDKSLDEVILSYLAEDLEPPPEKKK